MVTWCSLMQHIGKGLMSISQGLAHRHCSLPYTTLWYFQHFVIPWLFLPWRHCGSLVSASTLKVTLRYLSYPVYLSVIRGSPNSFRCDIFGLTWQTKLLRLAFSASSKSALICERSPRRWWCWCSCSILPILDLGCLGWLQSFVVSIPARPGYFHISYHWFLKLSSCSRFEFPYPHLLSIMSQSSKNALMAGLAR